MDDTLSVKSFDTTTIDAANKPGSALLFPRIEGSAKAGYTRQRLDPTGLSPTTIRIAHQPRVSATGVQRSVVSVEQDLTRLDTEGNPVGKTRVTTKYQTEINGDVTLTEYKDCAKLLFGFLMDASDATLTSVYNREV